MIEMEQVASEREKEPLFDPDKAMATFYGIVFRHERDVELASGMMYRPTEDSMLESFAEVFDKEAATSYLRPGELGILEDFVISIHLKLSEFSRNKLMSGYTTASPVAPFRDVQPREICKFVDPTGTDVGPTPAAIVYLEKGELKYRLGVNKNKNLTFDLSQNPKDIEYGSLGRVGDGVDEELMAKLSTFILSKKFSEHWRSLRIGQHELSEMELAPFRGNILPQSFIPEEDGIFPESMADMLEMEEAVVKSGQADKSWEEWDKSFRAWTVSRAKAGYVVFGFLDGEGRFIEADSSENVFDVYKKTGDIKILSYNPRPIRFSGRIIGHDPKTGMPLLEDGQPSKE